MLEEVEVLSLSFTATYYQLTKYTMDILEEAGLLDCRPIDL